MKRTLDKPLYKTLSALISLAVLAKIVLSYHVISSYLV